MTKKFFIAVVLAVMVTGGIFAESGFRYLKSLTTAGTSLNNIDIARAFGNEMLTYLSRAQYYFCDYEINYDKNRQDTDWALTVWQYDYSWGTIFEIRLVVSNGWFSIKTSSSDFTWGGIDAKRIVTFAKGTVGRNTVCYQVAETYSAFGNESRTVLKMFGSGYGQKSEDAIALIFAILMNAGLG